MDRNLDRRVEALVPVEDADARARLAGILDLMLADDRRSWQLLPDATWVRTETLEGRPGTIDTFETLKAIALAQGAVSDVPRRPGTGAARSTRTHDLAPAHGRPAPMTGPPSRRPGRSRSS